MFFDQITCLSPLAIHEETGGILRFIVYLLCQSGLGTCTKLWQRFSVCSVISSLLYSYLGGLWPSSGQGAVGTSDIGDSRPGSKSHCHHNPWSRLHTPLSPCFLLSTNSLQNRSIQGLGLTAWKGDPADFTRPRHEQEINVFSHEKFGFFHY